MNLNEKLTIKNRKDMKKILLVCASLACTLYICAQDGVNGHVYKDKRSPKVWQRLVKTETDDFFLTAEAKRIGDNVLLYQCDNGGWPKNIYMPAELSREEKEALVKAKSNLNETTIDNNATMTEMTYLARLYNATGDERYREAVVKGVEYMLSAQYDNGGWPQFYPRNYGYYTHITYNDNAMENVLKVLYKVSRGEKPYTFFPDVTRSRAAEAVRKGVECILNTQYVQDGVPTVWCAQHDEHTLLPAKARAYELESLSGAESAGVVLFLMSLKERPSVRLVKAVDNAVKWFEGNKITNLKREDFTDKEGRADFRMVECAPSETPADTLWARFYTLEDNRPYFCDRDGVRRYNISEIGHERRNHYGWYTQEPLKVLARYAKWKKELKRKYGME